MSLGQGALALKRIKLLTSPQSITFKSIVSQLTKGSITPIDMDDSRERSLGWCHPFNGEPDFSDSNDHIYGNTFVFGMRLDTKKIPGTLFRLQMKSALDSLGKRLSSAEGSDKRMSKKTRDATRDRIKLELLRRTLPSIRLVEIMWHMDSGEIWIASTSSAVVADFEALFTETFGIPFVQINAGTSLVDFDRIQMGQSASLQKLFDLSPVSLVRMAGPVAESQGTTAEDLF